MSPILLLVVHRIVYSLGTLVLVSMIIFAAVEVLPGDVAARILGRESSVQAREQLRTELGLNRPVVERYLSWAGGVLTGDLGVSLTARKPVAQIVFGRLANTLSLAGFALLLYVPLSILPALV